MNHDAQSSAPEQPPQPGEKDYDRFWDWVTENGLVEGERTKLYAEWKRIDSVALPEEGTVEWSAFWGWALYTGRSATANAPETLFLEWQDLPEAERKKWLDEAEGIPEYPLVLVDPPSAMKPGADIDVGKLPAPGPEPFYQCPKHGPQANGESVMVDLPNEAGETLYCWACYDAMIKANCEVLVPLNTKPVTPEKPDMGDRSKEWHEGADACVLVFPAAADSVRDEKCSYPGSTPEWGDFIGGWNDARAYNEGRGK